MAKELGIFVEPQCLIDSTLDGQLVVTPKILQQLEQLERPLVVISIAGLYRTGKSYLMNRLAGHRKGFALGATIKSMTKGIWIWVCDHPVQKNRYLVLLDTEGLGDAAKGDSNHDNQIFSLATLLSSTLVYNALGAISEDALAKLNFVTEISKHISVRSNKRANDDYDFDRFFPLFIFALRDFCLDLKMDGEEIDADQYLEHCLTPKPGKSKNVESFNRPRLSIRKYFKKRKCFTFDRPVSRKKLMVLDTIDDSKLSEDFVDEISAFLKYVYNTCPVKRLENGQEINGRMMASMVTTYVEAIRSGALPCIENAIKSMSIIENGRAVAGGVQLYTDMMDKLSLPTPTDKALTDHHFNCLKEAIKYYLDKAIMDEDHEYQKNMNEQIQEKLKAYVKGNEGASWKKCRDLLNSLEKALMKKLNDGVYAKSGGFSEYQQDIQDVRNSYNKHQNLGVQMEHCLLDYLQRKMKEGDAILAADKQVSAQEKATEAERQKAIKADLLRESAEREKKLAEQYAAEKAKAMKENIDRMEEKSEREMKEMKDHYEEVMKDRISEQQRLLKEGFQKEAQELREEIDKLKNPPKKEGWCVIS